MKYLSWSKNRLSGTIPALPPAPNRLVIFETSYNSLSGTVPAWLFNTSTLLHLALDYNNLQGSLPTIGVACSLLKFTIQNSSISGTLPADLFQRCSGMYELALSFNRFQGTIPQDFYSLPRIAVAYLDNNQLSGTISPLFMPTIRVLDLSGNALTGTLPWPLIYSPRLQSIRLGYNQIQDLGDCITPNLPIGFDFFAIGLPNQDGIPTVTSVGLQKNGLNVTVDSLFHCLKRCPYMSILDVSQNSLSGALTSDGLTSLVVTPEFTNRLASFSSLIRANLSSNAISGTICSFITEFTALEVLDFSDNMLSGTIPNGISNFAILVANNPLLQASALPAYLQFGPSFVVYRNPEQEPAYACREIITRNAALSSYRIAIDPNYLNYTHCQCLLGFYGGPPDCFSWKSRVQLLQAQGSLTDTVYGGRIRTGLSTQYLIQPPLTQANNSVVGVSLNFSFVNLTASTTDTVLVYADNANSNGRTLVQAFSASNLPKQQILVPGSQAVVHFLSDAADGLHFVADYVALDVCPAGYRLQNGVCQSYKDYPRWSAPAGLRIFFVIFALLCIVLCFVVFFFFLKHRQHPVIKASSPAFVLLTLAGLMIALLVPLLWNVVDDLDFNLCHAFPALGGISFSLVFGSLIAKTWRLYKIFWSESLAVQNIPDSTVFSVVAIFMLVELLLAIVWRIVQPMRGAVIHDITDTYTVSVCIAPSEIDVLDAAFLVAFFSFQAYVLICGTMLATRVRKLPDQFNETPSIVTCVYNVFVISALVVPLHFTLQRFPLIDFILVNVGVFVIVVFSLVILYAPKIIALAFNTEDSAPKLRMNDSRKSTHTSPSAQQVELMSELKRLKSENEQLRRTSEIEKLRAEVAQLRQQLGQV